MGLQPSANGSPINDASSILARRAGSLQWRNSSTMSNRDGRESVGSSQSQNQQQSLMNTMMQGGILFPTRQGNTVQVHNS